jgi:hypothetical protein
MRTFEDHQGHHWQAALLDASYGNIMLVFSAVHGDAIRQNLLGAENHSEAVATLDGMDDDDLRAALAEADPWPPGAGGF